MASKTVKSRMLLGIVCAALLAETAGWEPVGARIVQAWNYHELAAKADLIVIASAKSNKDIPEDRTRLARLFVMGVDTEFTTDGVLNAKAPNGPDVQRAGQTFVLHHYREAYPRQVSVNGPGLIGFDPKVKTQYLMFLTRRKDGRFEPVTGQVDPDLSFVTLEYPPGLEAGAPDEPTIGAANPAGSAANSKEADGIPKDGAK